MRYFFNRSDDSISILFDGQMHLLRSSQFNFSELDKHLQQEDHDYETIKTLLNPKELVARITAGSVSIVGDTVYYQGSPMHSALTTKLLSMLQAGYDVAPWAKFMDNLMKNPSERSRECLYEFLEKFQAPITPDGCFIAFKRVRPDFTDIHSGTFSNAIGSVVTMPREDVNENPDQTCSAGLHVCASSYLGNFYSGMKGNRVIAVKVNPTDVVAVPRDYNSAKMRTCGYEVLQEVVESGSEIRDIESQIVITEDGSEPEKISSSVEKAVENKFYIGQKVLTEEGEVVEILDMAPTGMVTVEDTYGDVYGTFTTTMHPLSDFSITKPTGMVVVDEDGDKLLVTNLYKSSYTSIVFGHYTDLDMDLGGYFGEELSEDVHYILYEPEEKVEMLFERGDLVWDIQQLKEQYANYESERELSRHTGVPRTTLQSWKQRVKDAGLW